MSSRKGKQKPRPTPGAGKAAALLREIARRRPAVTPDPDAADAQRRLLGAAWPYRDTAPLFFQTALRVGIVPEPPAVFTEPTSVLPVVRPTLLGLNDDETGETR